MPHVPRYLLCLLLGLGLFILGCAPASTAAESTSLAVLEVKRKEPLRCGTPTKAGPKCRRPVKVQGPCWMHRPTAKVVQP